MRVTFTPLEKELIDVCKVRNTFSKSCRGCKYNNECTALFSQVEQKFYELKEILKNGKKHEQP